MSKQSEDDYKACKLEPLLEQLGYPIRDINFVKRGSSNRFKTYAGSHDPDYIFYIEKKPILDIEAKPTEKRFEQGYNQATFYAINHPCGTIPFIVCAAGDKIEMFKAFPSEDGLNIKFQKLERILTWKELQQTVAKSFKPKSIEEAVETTLGLETFRQIFEELFSLFSKSKIKFKNRDEPVMLMNRIIITLIHGENLRPIFEANNFPKRLRKNIRGLLGRYSLIDVEGYDLAYAYRDFVTRSFTGITPWWAGKGEKEIGRYLTPAPVINFMVNLCKPNTEDKVIDFACGSGGFLGAIASRMLGKIDINKYLKKKLVGLDADSFSVSTALTFVDLLLPGEQISPATIHRGDLNIFHKNGLCSENIHSWETQNLSKYLENNSFDIVISNPPGGVNYNLGHEDRLTSNFLLEKGKDKLQNAPLFIQRAIQLATTGGKICLIVPDGILSNINLDYIRTHIFENCQVRAIISLPRGIFPNVPSKMSVIFMTKSKRHPKEKNIFMAGIQTGEDYNLEFELEEILQKYKKFRKQ